jgi:hemerythrin-like domain-containing protein
MTSPPKKPWADTPFPLLETPRSQLAGAPESPASKNASEMALIHNILLRGLNCIYNQAPNLKFSEDIDDFMDFCGAWSHTLRSHHKTEETVYFPLLEEQCSEGNKGVASKNHDEHERFLGGLGEFDEVVKGVKIDGVDYDSAKLLKIIDDFGPRLAEHLRNEIVLLQSLEADERIDWALMGRTMAEQSKKVADRVGFLSRRKVLY